MLTISGQSEGNIAIQLGVSKACRLQKEWYDLRLAFWNQTRLIFEELSEASHGLNDIIDIAIFGEVLHQRVIDIPKR